MKRKMYMYLSVNNTRETSFLCYQDSDVLSHSPHHHLIAVGEVDFPTLTDVFSIDDVHDEYFKNRLEDRKKLLLKELQEIEALENK